MIDVPPTADSEMRAALADLVTANMTQLERKLEQFAVASLEVLVTALEARDRFMAGHSLRVAQLSASLADALGYADDDVERVRLAARLHDIGMVLINDRTVNAAGPLGPRDRDLVRQHPVAGHQLLRPYTHMREIGLFVRGHHERWDGEGYPDGLVGDNIPWGARIIAAAETFDALVTSRVYRPETYDLADACAQMRKLAGLAFDPMVIDALIDVVGRRDALAFLPDHGEEGSDGMVDTEPVAGLQR